MSRCKEKNRGDIRTIRGHHLLCMQHFQGYGYDERFVANLGRIIQELRENPASPVLLTDTADEICRACPRLVGGECWPEAHNGVLSHQSGDKGNGPPGSIPGKPPAGERDRMILHFLGLAPGTVVDYALAHQTARALLQRKSLRTLCGDCAWISLCEDRALSRAPAQDEAAADPFSSLD